jgi:hypothetical protein
MTMIRRLTLASTISIACWAVPGLAHGDNQGFLTVEGPTLKARMDAAVGLGKATGKSFWAGYGFPVRAGVAVDVEINGSEGMTFINGVMISKDLGVETRNLGVFFRYREGGTSIDRAEIYNLDGHHDMAGAPVYWLATAPASESLDLLRAMIESNLQTEVARKCVAAIALHEDRQVARILEVITGQSYSEQIRGAAVLWLSHTSGEAPFLERLAGDERNSLELRMKAIRSIGMSDDPSAVRTLESIYDSAADTRIKREAVQAAGIGRESEEASAFLIKTATSNADRQIKKAAIFWLGQKAGQHALKTLTDIATGSSDDTEIQKQAVFAISRRPADEAVPLLINVARTHSNPRVRKQAVFWLGQIGDERCVEFFKELLSK